MVQMAILPIVTEVGADVSGAGGIFRIQLFLRLNFGKPGVTVEQSFQSFTAGRIDENMEIVTALLENALASPPHDYAIAHLRCLFNDAAG